MIEKLCCIRCGSIALNGTILYITNYQPTLLSIVSLSILGGVLGFIIYLSWRL